ncbi:MAG: SDR family oxidoreductase [Hyphomicrobium sp.]
MKKSVLVIGATSDIARATALVYAEAGYAVMLAARDVSALSREANDITTRTRAPVTVHAFDVLETARFNEFLDGLPTLPDTAICCVGALGTQARAETDSDHATMLLRTNFEGPAVILGLLAERFAACGHGAIVGVSSVAGDRGRQSNYVYGSAKAGLTAFLSGLRNRMTAHGVRVVTVKPGFVNTRMTAGMALPGLLTAEPDEVAKAIYRAAEERYRGTIYVRPVWRAIMAIICAIPDPIFRKLKL